VPGLPDGAQLPNLLPVLFPKCREISITCLVDAINALGGSLTQRRNDLLLGLDLGLDRQIDLLAGANGDAPPGWGKASALGGPVMPFGAPMYAVGGSTRSAHPAIRPAFGLWTEGYYYRFTDDGPLGSDGHSGVIYAGADYMLSSSVLVGAMVQFDQTQQDFSGFGSRAESDGWMVGPYATVRLSRNLFFQARAAWGTARNDLTAVPLIDDSFDSTRWLVRGTLLGQWQLGPWDIRPRASVGYIEEKRESYLSSGGFIVPSMSGSLGQAKFGSEIARKFTVGDGMVVEPSFLLEGIWNFEQSVTSPQVDDLIAGPDLRGRAELGLTLYTAAGASIGASVSYDGIGSDLHAIGGRARVRVPFN
jgi:outer membrane autotransporter protein